MLYPIETSDTLIYINTDDFEEIPDIKIIEWFIIKNVSKYQKNRNRLIFIAKCYYYNITLGCIYEPELQKEIDECKKDIYCIT